MLLEIVSKITEATKKDLLGVLYYIDDVKLNKQKQVNMNKKPVYYVDEENVLHFDVSSEEDVKHSSFLDAFTIYHYAEETQCYPEDVIEEWSKGFILEEIQPLNSFTQINVLKQIGIDTTTETFQYELPSKLKKILSKEADVLEKILQQIPIKPNVEKIKYNPNKQVIEFLYCLTEGNVLFPKMFNEFSTKQKEILVLEKTGLQIAKVKQIKNLSGVRKQRTHLFLNEETKQVYFKVRFELDVEVIKVQQLMKVLSFK